MTENQPMPSERWDYDGQYLTWYPKGAQSTIANWFCYAVRDGAKDVFHVLQDVERQALRKSNGWMTNELLRQFLDDLNDQEAADYAAFILWRESLPFEEKQRLKEASGIEHRNAYMAQEPPTEKQLKYLRGLGCKTVPSSKLQASQLIEECLAQKRGRAA